ncbi:MotA/TolQ/ExbB proton channel family protein [Helicobacter cappadocius]|uniref:MotA/TolQ/ExbB proton channel family protein n=1 Tax=Helicobacter cappadocius TaxID=3063998 RepID=A0AA90PHZ4_9HELI|nr:MULTISPECIES: MotA/TolQ/ExbB proton channel family protein [unclassified Helicobacter]MDO7252754.1 MotA/TolQ/ExbB proton channel family protein [Helicobacter sp. faydin-H75]MDP2538622.1 MotA/TolQ/ExbB proton channel family protein [Helicobacter sp. faydin-H76]
MTSIQAFFYESGAVTIFVISWLSIYFVLTLWIFVYKFFSIRASIEREKKSLDRIIKNEQKLPNYPIFDILGTNGNTPKEMLQIWKNQVLKYSTTGLVVLSIVSSTAPFIGLFGTVIEILNAFGRLGLGGQVSFDVIAPIISKALVATAAGILTAIPAYSFFLLLRRKTYDLSVYIQMQIDVILSKNIEHK